MKVGSAIVDLHNIYTKKIVNHL